MSRLRCLLANSLWYLSTLPESRRFHRALGNSAAAQEAVLRDILRQNTATVFGRRHGFDAIRSIEDYQRAVPLADYEDFEPYIRLIADGEAMVLTAEPVLLLEPTSGSATASKLIPYTRGLKTQFQRGIAPWMADLFRSMPALLGGQSYWSVTPAARQAERTAGGIPVGFEDDSDYLGGFKGWLVRATQAVPAEVKQVRDMDSFWYATLLFLLRSRNLALISVWNPTFLILLCGHLQRWWPQLAGDLARGTLSTPQSLTEPLQTTLTRHLRPDAVRAGEVRAAFADPPNPAAVHQALWPHLRLISCWRDGAAAEPAAELADLFPQATIQGKGLLATEGFVTLPVMAGGCLPALRSHFFEFLPGDGGGFRLLHQLEDGQTYSLVLTTAGGLYRYRLRDLVQVTGFYRSVPRLRFVGREDGIADHFGEKLHEQHVDGALRQSLAEFGLRPAFAMLALDGGPPPAYVLYLEDAAAHEEQLRRCGERFEEHLGDNFHYRYCRDLGQLAPVRVFRITANGRETYLHGCAARGQRLGDVKPRVLHPATGWTKFFDGSMLW
ncbi:GH3 auxin-responsive promoter family protein [Desulfuromonas sp. CSMB_57]|uniref:GH3 auxin-responsive promoter family protein n=1 Tax=Desulfuromonas sp. CSMB_57 TaxID=2807629 RepID=UPI0020BF8E30|nr:GH3 auxin-responsive promoter family protein [Desulfuromonas sp. CSMB_57]